MEANAGPRAWNSARRSSDRHGRPSSTNPHRFSQGHARVPRSISLVIRVVAFLGLGLLVVQYFERRQEREDEERAESLRRAPAELSPEDQAERDAENARRLSILYEGALRDTRNGQGYAQTEGYHKLLDTLVQTPDADLVAGSIGELDHVQALQRPDDLRGRTVTLRGLLADLWAYKLDRSFIGGDDVWRAVVLEADGTEPVIVDFVTNPPRVELLRDPVDIHGVFYRTVSYETKLKKTVEVPYLIARTFQIVDTSPRGVRGWLERNILLVLAIVAALGVGISLWLSKLSSRARPPSVPGGSIGFKEMFERRIGESRSHREQDPPLSEKR